MSASNESFELNNTVTDPNGKGDVPISVQTQNSVESLASAIFPWLTNIRRVTGNRRAPVARYEAGRTITSVGFYLCMMSILLLCTGVGLTIVSIFLLIYRVPYVQITDASFHTEAINFTICAGVVSILCWWIGWIAHDNKKNYVFLPLMIVVLALSLSMLLTAVGVGIVQKSRLVFDRTVKPPKLASSKFQTILNDTLNSTLRLYDENDLYKTSWNRVQQRLGCCGIDGPEDWSKNDKDIPWSCYRITKNNESRSLTRDGCFDKIAHELEWEVCLLIGLSMIAFCIQVITMFLVCGVYIGDKVKRNNVGTNNNNYT